VSGAVKVRRALATKMLLCVLGSSLVASPVCADDPDGALVRVTGAPEGATVVVDRAPFGTIPFERRLSPGLHYFVVSAPGYFVDRRDVEVSESLAPIDLRFELTLDPSLQPRGANAPMIVGGSVLALTGLAGVVLAIVGATGDRHCSARCDEPGARHVVERPAVDAIVAWSVAGGLALVVGTVLVVIGATSGGPARGGVTLRSDGLAVVF
jgi:hypothetical protein